MCERHGFHQLSYVGGPLHQRLSDVEHTVAVEPKDMVLVGALDQVSDAPAHELVQLFKNRLGLLRPRPFSRALWTHSL